MAGLIGGLINSSPCTGGLLLDFLSHAVAQSIIVCQKPNSGGHTFLYVGTDVGTLRICLCNPHGC